MNVAKHEVGSLVRARGRDWVVQPESYQIDDLIVLNLRWFTAYKYSC